MKYLVKFKEGKGNLFRPIYSEEEIAKQIVDEFKDLNNPSNLFILANIAKYSSREYYLAKKIIDAKTRELYKLVNKDNNTLKVEEVFKQEFKEFKKI